MYVKRQQELETGGPVLVESLADAQQGPTCAAEAVENIVQLFYPAPNSISGTDLIHRADSLGGVVWQADGPVLEPWVYQGLLANYGIPAEWHDFDAQLLVDAVQANRGVLAVVDAHQLRPRTYQRPESWHAVVVTNVIADSLGRVLEFVGLDSNFPGTQQRWSLAAFTSAASGWMYMPLLITTKPVRWRRKISHYLKQPDGRVIAMRGSA